MKHFVVWTVGCFSIIVFCVLIALGIYIAPTVRYWVNYQNYRVQKADDISRYSTRKQVEDNARAMIASWNVDYLTYLRYVNSSDPQQRSWGEQACIRANRTSQIYNEYVRKNSFVWKDAIPVDIDRMLEPIQIEQMREVLNGDGETGNP